MVCITFAVSVKSAWRCGTCAAPLQRSRDAAHCRAGAASINLRPRAGCKVARPAAALLDPRPIRSKGWWARELCHGTAISRT
jgi:hypothetical protein